jgi:hypothetical protein
VTGYGERTEGAEISTVLECEQAEGDDDKEDGFLMDMPAEEKGGVAAERES